MHYISRTATLFLLILLFSQCNSSESHKAVAPKEKTSHPKEQYHPEDFLDTTLSDSMLHDKILGMLLGSAIGDAMGAPTEMWSRDNIILEYGHVDQLDMVLREASPEGPWDFNLPAGGTTDDTRWKELTIEYLHESEKKRSASKAPFLQTADFAQFIVDQYVEGIKALKATDSFDPEPFEVNARKMTWLQEWALVAKPYADNDLDGYSNALSHFYGGEMSCAGMLYAPTLGAFYPGKAERAYMETYKLAIFDLGYARDLSGIIAAMTSAALSSEANQEAVTQVTRDVDPEAFFKSRLIGRTAYRFHKIANSIQYQTQQIKDIDPDKVLNFPKGYPHDSLYYVRTLKAYELLDQQLQDIAFHAGEIFLINLTALLFSEMDFEKALQFITNYGRDNDTIGAICGAILGAYHGANNLPPELVNQVIKTNKEDLDIDLEALAKGFSDLIISRKR